MSVCNFACMISLLHALLLLLRVAMFTQEKEEKVRKRMFEKEERERARDMLKADKDRAKALEREERERQREEARRSARNPIDDLMVIPNSPLMIVWWQLQVLL